jgi:Uma2 family endonuclease
MSDFLARISLVSMQLFWRVNCQRCPQYDVRNRDNPMAIETTKKLFTVDEYYRMADAGILGPEDRVELIDGEIIEMSPIGSRHLACVNRANRLFVTTFGVRVVVSVQHPLQLSNYTEPEPDIVLLRPREDDYAAKKPSAEDALLVVEVADTTLRFDMNVKLPRYAAAGVPEVWIENLPEDLLLVYRDPDGPRYLTSLVFRGEESVTVQALPGVTFSAAELLVEG